MKILVGIMYCIENEVDECIAAIQEQTYKEHHHFVINNLPNKEAHEKLYQTFMNSAEKYDLFIKVDADMVLARKTFFYEVIECFRNDKVMDFLQIAVHDFFTNRLIYGLHIYRNTVKWVTQNEQIFVDQKNVQYRKRVLDDHCLAPAAFHCPNPSLFQAFHFGLHKAVKVMQIGKEPKSYSNAATHWQNIWETRKNFDQTNDVRLGFALLGAELAFKHKLTSQHVDFNNTKLLELFKSTEAYDLADIRHYLKKKLTFGYLRPTLRFELLFLSSDHIAFFKRPVAKTLFLLKSICTNRYSSTIKAA